MAEGTSSLYSPDTLGWPTDIAYVELIDVLGPFYQTVYQRFAAVDKPQPAQAAQKQDTPSYAVQKQNTPRRRS